MSKASIWSKARARRAGAGRPLSATAKWGAGA